MNRVTPDSWSDLRGMTAARIALGRSGGSLPTAELLDFGLAHARARDAVKAPFDVQKLLADLQSAGLSSLVLRSAVENRDDYLRRPDWGRRLSESSRQQLVATASLGPFDLCCAISDGLSSRATDHAIAVLAPLHVLLMSEGWRIAPIAVVPFGRVAIQDEIGEYLGATLSLMLLGERPGLGSPDSLGAYFVHHPRVGKSDADRNCVSNIRPAGLPPAAAVATLHYLLNAARTRGISGVTLKDERLLAARDPSTERARFRANP
ncbi:MAG: ethanolamine ammonia-lyase subunit EutC [Planctomycetes bacterium]|nr:ethanolamine ammonia-lyase subunit EutC [Planctomycetota bacterium]